MRQRHIKLTSLIATIMTITAILVAIGFNNISVYAANISTIEFRGKFNFTEAANLVNNIDRDRTSGGGFYFDSNGNKVSAIGLNHLQYDSFLCTVAEQRAAELAVSYSNTRPNGTSFDTYTYKGINSNQEFIYKDTTAKTGNQMYDIWFAYGYGGAASAMMYPYFQSVGAACFTYNGTTYWVLEFSVNKSSFEKSTTSTTGEYTMWVEYDDSKFTPIYKLHDMHDSYECNVGEKISIDAVLLDIYRGEVYERTTKSSEISCTYTPNNTSAFNLKNISNKEVQPLKVGTFTITITVKVGTKTQATKTITIKSNQNSMGVVTQSNYPSVTYTGSAITDVNLTLEYNGITLVKGTDYKIISGRNNTNVTNEAYVTVEGIGGRFSGKKEFKFYIVSRSISDAKVTCNQEGIQYTGKEITPTFKVVVNNKTLTAGTDYTISYFGTIKNPDTYTITINGKGNYSGNCTYKLVVSNYAIRSSNISNIPNQTYTGSAITPEITVTANGTKLAINSDYTVKYDNNTNAGTATVVITMKGYYTGTITKTFTINKYKVNNSDVPTFGDYTYSGSYITPTSNIYINGKKLVQNTDYTITYTNNKNVGTATVTYSFIGNYEGNFTRSFTIKPYEVKSSDVGDIKDVTYSGASFTPSVLVYANGILTKNTDYTIEYQNNLNVGTATAIYTFTGNYTGTVTKTFQINPYEIKSINVSIKDNKQTYTGEPIEPLVEVSVLRNPLIEGVDYDIEYSNNIDVGTASVIITGKGNYTGSITKTFSINAAPTPTPTATPSPTITVTVSPTSTPTVTTPITVTPTPSNNTATGGSGNTSTTTPTPNPTTPASTVVPTTAPSTPVPTLAPELNVGDFVDRCYKIALNRNADNNGYNYWVSSLNDGQICGAQAAYGFIFSAEYIQKNTSNECFVTDLYLMFFDREPDTSGFEYWVNMLNNNEASREEIFAGFANSLEFYNLCNRYAVVSGYYLVGINNDQQGGVNAFVARLYKVCLNRLPDQGGQSGWVEQLISGQTSGTNCSYGFVFSPEFIEMNLGNEEFVKYMYRAFFGREADDVGLEYWVNQLKVGTSSRLDVFNGFAGSIEFAALCASYGINP